MLRSWQLTKLIFSSPIIVCLLCQPVLSNIDNIVNAMYRTKSTDEEVKSIHVPEEYMCDACTGIAYSVDENDYGTFLHKFDRGIRTTKRIMEELQKKTIKQKYSVLWNNVCLGQIFTKTEKKYRRSKLTESVLLDKIEILCENETHWHDYMLKEIDGVKRFTGPGTDTEEDWGLVMNGDFWPYRMMDLCMRLVGPADSVELYNSFKNGQLKETLCVRGEKQYCKPRRKISDEL